jgi:hypothetical protein
MSPTDIEAFMIYFTEKANIKKLQQAQAKKDAPKGGRFSRFRR